MFLLKGIEQLRNAISKARKLSPAVKFDRFCRYRVSGSRGGYYTVIAAKMIAESKRLNALAGARKRVLCAITRRH